MDLADFDYHLPEELIAQEPLADRAAARMLVVYRAARTAGKTASFANSPRFCGPGDCLVLNDSRVFPARLFGHRAGVRSLPIGQAQSQARATYLSGRGGGVSAARASPPRARLGGAGAAGPQDAGGRTDSVRRRPGRRRSWRAANSASAPSASMGDGRPVRGVRKNRPRAAAAVHQAGRHAPSDRERYQTVFAREKGSVAAPTAGLHFTGEILEALPRAAERRSPA